MKNARHRANHPTPALAVFVLVFTFFLLPAAARAGSRHHGGWERGHRGRADCTVAPRHYTRVHLGHRTLYHHRGVFYRKGPRGFTAVRAPIGAVVTSLPAGFSILGSGRSTVFLALGTAYQRCHRGFVVVKHPRHQRSWHRHGYRYRHGPWRDHPPHRRPCGHRHRIHPRWVP